MKRRDFMKFSGLGAATLATNALDARGQDEGERRFKAALIGTGWYGKVDLFRLMQVAPVDVVALCDVDREAVEDAKRRVAARQGGVEPRCYADYRELLEKEKLDIALVATPDHWHALITIAAIEKGVDVYVQKPIGVDVAECVAMLKAARDKGAVVQVGLQRRSTPHLMEAKREIVDSGELGRVGHVDIFSYYGGPGRAFQQDPTDVPEGFDYDFWCGPAPKLPYYPCLRKRTWRMFMEYGNGTVGDMGVHMFDMARWILGLRYPRKIFSTGGQYIKRGGISNITDTQTIIFDYGDLEIVWNHRNWCDLPEKRHPWGGYFYGERGVLKASVFGYDFRRYYSDDVKSGEVLYENDKYPEDQKEEGIELFCASAIREHMRDFVDRIADRGRPRSDIEEGAISTICCILGNISMTLGRPIEWDETTNSVKNDDEANALLARGYRAPWIHP